MYAQHRNNMGPSSASSCLANRFDYVKKMLDMKTWSKLSEMVKSYRPHIVVSAARKMPRVISMLQNMPEPLFDFHAEFVSDFAIEFMAEKLKDKRIAILDDAINVGSTMTNIWLRLAKYAAPDNITCFCIACRKDKGQAIRPEMRVECACETGWDEAAYKASATRLSMALWTLNRPLEVEFPVFRSQNVPRETLFSIAEQFAEQEEGYHGLDIPEAPYFGLRRFGVDLDPESAFNEKTRFYIDLENNELVIVPMAWSWQDNANAQSSVAERFKASLRLGKKFFAAHPCIPQPELDCAESRLLFGDSRPAPVTASLKNGGSNHPREQSHEFLKNDWPKIRKSCEIADPHFLNDCFEAFFIAAAKYYDTENGTDHERLCMGPTFGELLTIMKGLWVPPQGADASVLSRRLSELLDKHIDQGFVVPMNDKNGRRIFRKGEPWPFSHDTLELMSIVHGNVDPANNARMAAENFSAEEKRRLEHMRLLLEKELCLI